MMHHHRFVVFPFPFVFPRWAWSFLFYGRWHVLCAIVHAVTHPPPRHCFPYLCRCSAPPVGSYVRSATLAVLCLPFVVKRSTDCRLAAPLAIVIRTAALPRPIDCQDASDALCVWSSSTLFPPAIEGAPTVVVSLHNKHAICTLVTPVPSPYRSPPLAIRHIHTNEEGDRMALAWLGWRS